MKQVIYSKFSNERNYRFGIRTDILEDEEGNRFVQKVSDCPEGQLHMTELYGWYQLFSKACEGTWLNYNRCEIIPGGVELEYVRGESLEAYLEEVEKEQGRDAMAELFRKYLRNIRDMHALQDFEETARFRNVFGDFQADAEKLELKCAPATNIDLICENILLHDGMGTVIDYEWSFGFPIPVNYLLYRNIFYFREHAGRDYLDDYDFYGEFGITAKEIWAYERMEENLQHYVCRDHIPVRDLYRDISPGLIRMDDRRHTDSVQIFYDLGEGFYEELSEKFQIQKGRCAGTLKVSPEWKALRIDPGALSGFVQVGKLEAGGQDLLGQAVLGKGVRRENWLCFPEDDPNLVISELPGETLELTFDFQIWPLENIPAGTAARWMQELCAGEHLIQEMKNTKVWKAYQKYRDAVERKHE